MGKATNQSIMGIGIQKTVAYFLAFAFLSSCSANYHLQRAKRHKLIAISKGAKVESDTVYIDRLITNKVPGDSLTAEITPVIDDKSFDATMVENDSLTLVLDSIRRGIERGHIIDREKAMASLELANKEIRTLRSRIKKGFSKDSTYTYKPDSVTTIEVRIKGGVLSKVNYKRMETTVTESHKIPVSVNEEISVYGLSQWQLLLIGLGLFFLAIAIGYFFGRFTAHRR